MAGKERQPHRLQQLWEVAVALLQAVADPVNCRPHKPFASVSSALHWSKSCTTHVLGQLQEIFVLPDGLKVAETHPPGELVQLGALVRVGQQQHAQAARCRFFSRNSAHVSRMS